MTDDVSALLAKARRHLETVDQVQTVEGRRIAPTGDQRIQLAQAYALLAIAERLQPPSISGGAPQASSDEKIYRRYNL
jgi:hypothetical protein